MTTLHFGVIDVPYSDGEGKTTGDVAEILEGKYDVIGVFIDIHEDEIAKALENHMMNLLENAEKGRPVPQGEIGFPKVESEFKDYLDRDEWQSVTNQTIESAKKGISHRKLKPYAKGEPRPAFIDTGLYQQSFKVWLEP